jgi:hypothetical protein
VDRDDRRRVIVRSEEERLPFESPERRLRLTEFGESVVQAVGVVLLDGELDEDLGIFERGVERCDLFDRAFVPRERARDPEGLVLVAPEVRGRGEFPQLDEFGFFAVDVKGTSGRRRASSGVRSAANGDQSVP